MLLVIDVGNTNTVMGVYDGPRLIDSWRVRTERNTTADEFDVLAANLFQWGGLDLERIEKIVVSSVVPPMAPILDGFCRRRFGRQPFWVDAKSYKGMPNLYSNPAEVGADRIVNSVAAYAKYETSLVVIDFGTATTFDAISEKGEYLGGAICPGIMISSESLFQHASKLPRVEIFAPPENVIGKNTAESIQSGIIFGYAGLVDGIVARIKNQMGGSVRVIATGGLAGLMYKVSDSIEAVEPDLTLEGLRIISEAL